MKMTLLAGAAVLCLGGSAAYAADSGADGGEWSAPGSFFADLPGVFATAPGMPPNNVAVNAYTPPYQPEPPQTTATVPPRNSGS
jgi:hypothetical protein